MKKVDRLVDILKRLNSGENPEQVKKEAEQFLSEIDARDLSLAEQKLIDEGLTPADVQELCKIHLQMLSDKVGKMKASLPAGHVVSTLVSEHEEILSFLDKLEYVNKELQQMPCYDPEADCFDKLSHIAEHLVEAELHHKREEEVLFPELEKRGVYGPPAVMRQEHDQLRPRKHKLKELADKAGQMDFEEYKKEVGELVEFIVPSLREHIFKENNILYPTAVEVIDDSKVWYRLRRACDEIGYCCFTPES